jgi:hypothetical protein
MKYSVQPGPGRGIIEPFQLQEFFFPAYEHGHILYLNVFNLNTFKLNRAIGGIAILSLYLIHA